jgi:hypothetical protein
VNDDADNYSCVDQDDDDSSVTVPSVDNYDDVDVDDEGIADYSKDDGTL